MARPDQAPSNAIRRPALWVFVLFAVGLALGRELGGVSSLAWFALSACAATATFPLRRWRCRATLALAAVFFGAGWWGWRMEDAPRRTLAAALSPDADRPLTVEGTVLERPRYDRPRRGRLARFQAIPRSTRFQLSVHRATPAGGAPIAARGTLAVRVDGGGLDLDAGERVCITGMATGVDGPRNPGERDARLWAAQRAAAGYLSVPSTELVEPLPRPHASLPALRARLLALRETLRARAGALLESDDGPSDPARALLAALLLGEQTDALYDVRRSFTRLGLAHVLAISGLHLAALAWAALFALRLTGDRGWLEPALVALAVCVYLFIVPAQTPVVRAGAMVLAFLAAEACGRRYDRLALLAWIAVGILLWRPLELWSAGFQLSFGVVAALLTLTRPVRERWFGSRPEPDTMRWPTRAVWATKEALVAAVVAWLVATPIVALHFGIFSPYAVAATLVLGPPVTLLLGVGYGAMLLGAIWPTLGHLAAPALHAAAGAIAWAASVADRLPGAVVYLPRLSPFWAVAALAVVVYWLRCGALAPGRMSVLYPRARIAAFFAAATIVAVWFGAQMTDTGLARDTLLRIDTLDVGDGSCHLVRARAPGSGVEAMLWDCGAGSMAFGERDLPRAVRALGAGRRAWRPGVTTVVITHPNLDHYNALLDAAEPLGVRRVLVGEAVLADAESDPDGPVAFTLRGLERQGVEVRAIAAGERFALGGATVTFLSPPAGATRPNANDSSLVARVTVAVEGAAERRLLLCGDIEGPAMRAMAAAGVDIGADIMEAPHHGSAKPDAYAFVLRADPKVVIQSTGPRRVGDDRWDDVRRGRRWRTTALDGAVTIRVHRDGTIIDTPFRPPAGRDERPLATAPGGAE